MITLSSAIRIAATPVLMAAAQQGLAVPPASFTGPYAVVDGTHPAAVYTSFSPPAGGKLGGWSAAITPGATIDTLSAPGSVVLNAGLLAPLSQGFSPLLAPVGSFAELSIAAPAAGLFSFNYNLAAGQLEVFSSVGLQTLTGSGSLSLDISVGENFGFRVVSDTFASAPASSRRVALPAAPGPQGVTISSAVFTEVPEASSVLAGLGLVGLVGGRWLMRRRQA